MTNDDYDKLLSQQGSGWRKTLGMESGVAATREERVSERLDELAIIADDEGTPTHELSQGPARAIAIAIPSVSIYLHDDGCHAVSFEAGSYRINLTFRPQQVGRCAIIEGTAVPLTPSARTAIPSSNLIADALDVETGGSS